MERDFSDMEAMFANSSASNIGQELLEAKMMVNSAMKGEASNCARCIEAQEDRKKRALAGEKLPTEKCQHCHCKFLAELRNFDPAKKDKKKEVKSVKETESKKKKRDEAEKISKEEEAGKIRKEVNLLRKRYLEQKKSEKKKSDEGKEDVVKKKKAKKRIAIEKVDVTKKRKKKLAFLN